MRKESYVNIKDIYEIPFKVLHTCWKDLDFHLNKESYQMLVTDLFQRNVDKLAVRLEDYSISCASHQPAATNPPAPTLDYSDDEGRGGRLPHAARYAGSSGSPRLSARYSSPVQYGTFTRGSIAAPYQYAPGAGGSNNARPYEHARGTYSGYQHVQARLDVSLLPRNRYSTAQRDVHARRKGGLTWLQAFVIFALVVVIAYFGLKP